jgi:hypothetical protein
MLTSALSMPCLIVLVYAPCIPQHVCCSPFKPWAAFIINPAGDAVKAAAAHFTQRLHRAGVPVRVNGVAVYPVPACGSTALPGTTCGRTCTGEGTTSAYYYQGLCPDRLVRLPQLLLVKAVLTRLSAVR